MPPCRLWDVTYLEVTHDVTDCETVKFVFDPNSSNRLKNSSSLGPIDSHNEQFDFFLFNFEVLMNFDGWVGSDWKNPRPKFFILLFLKVFNGFLDIHYVLFLCLDIMFNSNMLKINKKDFSKEEHHEEHLSLLKSAWSFFQNLEEVFKPSKECWRGSGGHSYFYFNKIWHLAQFWGTRTF